VEGQVVWVSSQRTINDGYK